jgi:hypothetical protein
VLEQRDAKTYDALRAGQDIQVARSSLTMQDVKVASADIGVRLAGLQRERAQVQDEHFTQLVNDGLNGYESAGLAALGTAAYLQTLAGVTAATGAVGETFKAIATFGLFGKPAEDFAQSLSAFAGAASTGAQIAQTYAGYERRTQEWEIQRDVARKDIAIGDQQIA